MFRQGDEFRGRDHALFLDCRPDAAGGYRTELVPLPTGYSILIADSGVRHSNVRGEYNQRVAACRAGVKLLQRRFSDITHLRDVQDVPWQDLAPLLPEHTTAGELTARGIDLGDLPGLTANTPLKVRARCRELAHLGIDGVSCNGRSRGSRCEKGQRVR